MKGLFKKVLAGIMMFTMLCPMMAAVTPAKAANVADLKLGFLHESNLWSKEYYRITLDKETLLHVEVYVVDVSSNYLYSDSIDALSILNADEKVVIDKNDFFSKKDSFSGIITYKASVILDSGLYYLYLNAPYLGGTSIQKTGGSFIVTAQTPVSLKAVKITSLESTKKGTLTVKVSEKDEDAEHIDIEYATNKDFTDAKVVSIDDKNSITIKDLEKGKKYYVRARQITYYGDGGMSVSAWSIVKSATVRKK